MEQTIQQEWKDENLYKQIEEKNKDGPTYNQCDGPPFVSSDNLHMGHILISMMKSLCVNYHNMKGFSVKNKLGYDVHGLPSEMVVNKLLGIHNNNEVINFGVGNYITKCIDTINSYSGAWQPFFTRIARFCDFNNEYKTMNVEFMESVWWAFKQLWNKGLVYNGFKVMPYSTECGTPLSASESSGDDVYQEVEDMTVYVKFKIGNDYIIAWTTTPWTLPSNLALAISKNIKYVRVLDHKSQTNIIVCESSLQRIYGKDNTRYTLVGSIDWSQLENQKYEPLFSYFKDYTGGFKIICADFVTDNDGTGIVHLAPAFGEDDFNACIKESIINVQNVGQFCPIDTNCHFIEPVNDYIGRKAMSVNKDIIDKLLKEGKVLKTQKYKHRYPHCWRTGTPLMYRTIGSWFVNVESIKNQMIVNNKKSNWVPSAIGNERFGNWIENAKDWSVSRSRFFGTPLPIWKSDDGTEIVCIGSIDELVELCNLKERPTDLHLSSIQHLTIPSKNGKGELKLIGDVFDCWFESGCVPFAQYHYPFENSNMFDNVDYLSDFICEGLDQTRGWFYTLTVLSTALFNKPAFKNVICCGLILASDGKKISKRLGNYTNPKDICDIDGADALRLYLIGSVAAHADPLQFDQTQVNDIKKKYYQLYNSVQFLIEAMNRSKVGKINTTININNIMDQWLIDLTHQFIIGFQTNIEQYTFYKIKQLVLDYIENLTNWYIKFNRNRLKNNYCTIEETINAITVLYYCLMQFIKAFAPVAPYLSDYLYKILLNSTNEKYVSIHLCDYPQMDSTLLSKDNRLNNSMRLLQNISNMVRYMRTQTKTHQSRKNPINSITLVGLEDCTQFKQYIEKYLLEEINCLEIKYLDTYGTVTYNIEPNKKNIGVDFKVQSKTILELLSKMTPDSDNFTPVINGEKLDQKYYSIKKNVKYELQQNELSQVIDSVLVICDFTLTNQVMINHTMRLIISCVQEHRKMLHMKGHQHVNIEYYTEDSGIIEAIEKYKQSMETEINGTLVFVLNKENMISGLDNKFLFNLK